MKSVFEKIQRYCEDKLQKITRYGNDDDSESQEASNDTAKGNIEATISADEAADRTFISSYFLSQPLFFIFEPVKHCNFGREYIN